MKGMWESCIVLVSFILIITLKMEMVYYLRIFIYIRDPVKILPIDSFLSTTKKSKQYLLAL